MRQVPPSTLQLLFQGISHDGQGRALYLRERHRQKPEEKFQYPILSSWEYGWHVGKGHHHLAILGLCRQALPPSQASCFITPHQQLMHAPGSGLSVQAKHLHTSRPLHFLVSIPGMLLLPRLPLLVNFHMLPPLGILPRILQADVSPPLCLCSFLSL